MPISWYGNIIPQFGKAIDKLLKIFKREKNIIFALHLFAFNYHSCFAFI